MPCNLFIMENEMVVVVVVAFALAFCNKSVCDSCFL